MSEAVAAERRGKQIATKDARKVSKAAKENCPLGGGAVEERGLQTQR